MNVRIATIPTSEPTTACFPYQGNTGSRSVLHLNSLITYALSVFILFEPVEATHGFASGVAPQFALLCEVTLIDSKSYKPFEPTPKQTQLKKLSRISQTNHKAVR